MNQPDNPAELPPRSGPPPKSWTTGETLMFAAIIGLCGLFMTVLIVGLCYLLFAA
jgi:hypothetical protein